LSPLVFYFPFPAARWESRTAETAFTAHSAHQIGIYHWLVGSFVGWLVIVDWLVVWCSLAGWLVSWMVKLVRWLID